MKRIILAMAILLHAASSFSQVKDSEGHILVNQWKTLNKAVQADLPQDQLKALEAIKKEASGRRLAWDWYDAASRYVQVRSNVNWKEYNSLREALDQEVKTLDEPVVSFYHFNDKWSQAERREYVEQNKTRLQAGNNPEFHAQDYRLNSLVYRPALLDLLKNDYEYTLWSLFMGGDGDDLEDYCEGRYPEEALIEYTKTAKYWDKDAYGKLGDYVKKYSGKAVSLLARQRRLEWEFRELNNSKTAKSKDYKALKEACEAFERDRKQFTGGEKKIADCCKEVESLIKTLDSKNIDIQVKDGELTLVLRNISSLRLQVKKDDKSVWETSLANKAASYYVQDTLKTTLPDLDDADYEISCKSGVCESECQWRKHTLSIASRPDSKGWGIFVADYFTGEPVKSCELQLLDADGKLITSAEDFRPDGFSPLPAKLAAKLGGNRARYQLRAQLKDTDGRVRNSCELSFTDRTPSKVSDDANVERGVLLTDRSAFNPGETVQFKAICYTGTYEYRLAPEGRRVKVVLVDPQGKTVDSIDLTTNDFGSVAGSFQLTSGSRGGIYNLRLEQNGKTRAIKALRVDEFILPTFELTWDEDKTLYMPGDRIKVSGVVKAYSGHSTGDALVRYSVGKNNGSEETGELKLGSDGSFSFDFLSESSNWRWSYPITVTVTDGTGETLSFNCHRTIYNSVPLSLRLENEIPGTYTLSNRARRYGYSDGIVRDDTADILFNVGGLNRESLKISWKVTSDASGKTIADGSAGSGETVRIPIAKLPSGLYRVEARATATVASGSTVETVATATFVKAADSDTSLNMDVLCFFKELDAEDIALQVGTTDGPAWVVIELFGSGNVLLDSQIVKLDGKRGKAGSLKTISYTRKSDWPESLKLCALFFHKGEVYRYTRSIELPVASLDLPLEFTRFADRTRPGESVSLLIQTTPGVECAATVFDKATETIQSNRWSLVTPRRKPEPSVSYTSVCGVNQSSWGYVMNKAMTGSAVLSRADGMVMEESAAAADLEDSAPYLKVEEKLPTPVREDFDATMAWEPFLRSGADGSIELNIKGSDRLSTYYVQLFAHAEGMHNATLRRELQVTIPVKLSLVEPKYLYENDVYVARATIASTLDRTITGRVAIRFYDGLDRNCSRVLATKTQSITLPACGATGFDARFCVPEGVSELGVLLNFVPDEEADGSDAMFVSIPVYKPFQTLTEAHSALLRNPADRARIVSELRSLFVNLDASDLQPEERSILQMVREAIPDKVEPRCKDVMSLTEAWYANVLARRLGAPGLDSEALEEIKTRIAACQNSGGGIAWFEGMASSPILTAAVLQRIASMPEENVPIDIAAAVKYLDTNWFEGGGKPWWCGGISLEKYLQTRAMFAYVPFEVKTSAKALRQFKKDVKAYLVPGAKRGLNGQILAKARRLRTLQLLSAGAEGQKLAKSWGISFKKSVLRSMEADIESLLQYAVEHVSGGMYYPNAIMPWRGLLESELYAHSLLCDLLTDFPKGKNTAEGIRLWLMIQKETQQWGTDAAYIEALASVLRGTQETLDTRVILLSGTFTKPFEAVKAAGNGFTVSCKWYSGDKEISEGDVLRVGDKVTAKYSVWSEENRSFVRISAPRPASFRPANQLSGHYGWWMAPLNYDSWSIVPQGYRNVLGDKTEYWFDSYPEEKTTITEEFYVTQEGAFQLPAIEVESLYAPHYRANDAGRGAAVSR